ncbi:ribosome recycling factor [Schleiferia thermophila]|uniref:ribosome recycling factor n=1 Tax=Schleiferia thermophila TaxID=884107 RepID=UPI003EEEC303
MDEIQLILETAEEGMKKAVHHLEKELVKIRAGKANPALLESIKLDYYGVMSPLHTVANVMVPDARTITVQPWEKKMIPEIEKAIMNSGLGLNPQNNGEMVIINIPPLTEERRKDLVKQSRSEAEHARVGIRAARKEANDELKKLQNQGVAEDLVKDAEERVQKLTNQYIAKVDQILEKKETDIMTV